MRLGVDREQGGEDVKERPIIFSSQMVEALFAHKTQTRRLVTHQLPFAYPHPGGGWIFSNASDCPPIGKHGARSPYGQPGDRLWVREAWAVHFMYDDLRPSAIRQSGHTLGDRIWHRTMCSVDPSEAHLRGKWRSPIHIPRWASRVNLEVVGKERVERLLDISEDDARAELGWEPRVEGGAYLQEFGIAQGTFLRLWDELNGSKAPARTNPWVWAVEFQRIAPCPPGGASDAVCLPVPKKRRGCCFDGSCNGDTCMVLPEGCTCGECKHFKRCSWLMKMKPTSDCCDFFPRRFESSKEK